MHKRRQTFDQDMHTLTVIFLACSIEAFINQPSLFQRVAVLGMECLNNGVFPLGKGAVERKYQLPD